MAKVFSAAAGTREVLPSVGDISLILPCVDEELSQRCVSQNPRGTKGHQGGL